MKKRVLSGLLCGIFAALTIAGCAYPVTSAPAPAAPAEEAAAPEEAAPVEETAEAPAEEAAEPETAEAPAEEAAAPEDEDVTTIKLLLIDIRGNSTEGMQAVIDAMNDITREKIGVVAEATWDTLGNHGQNVNLAISANEPYDLVATLVAPADFAPMYSAGQLMDVTEILEEYAPDLFDVMGPFIYAESVGGRIYGVANLYNYASNGYILMRKDLLEQYDLLDDADNAVTWDDMVEVWKKLSEETGMVALGDTTSVRTIYASDVIDEAIGFDNIGENYTLLGTDTEGNVFCLLDDEGYRKQQERVREWYNDGLVYKDLVYSAEDTPDNLIAANTTFAYIHHSELGVEVAKEQATGYPMYARKTSSIPLKAVTRGLCFPITCQEPEAAAKWLNELYTNPELQNLITWGIEGKDYVVEDGMARYPDGVDTSNVSYHGYDFMYGNNYNALPWTGTSADFRELCKADVAAHAVSPYSGFVADLSGMDDLMAAISTCYDKYYKKITYGAWTDEDWENYRNELSAAGLDDYLNTYQTQLKEFLENK